MEIRIEAQGTVEAFPRGFRLLQREFDHPGVEVDLRVGRFPLHRAADHFLRLLRLAGLEQTPGEGVGGADVLVGLVGGPGLLQRKFGFAVVVGEEAGELGIALAVRMDMVCYSA